MEGSITPRSAEPGATDAATRAPGRRRAITIGRSRALRRSSLGGGQLDERARGVQVADHQRERLLLAALASAQLGYHTLVVGPAREVVAADALDRDDLPGGERRCAAALTGSSGRLRPARAVDQARRRPARRAGVRLRVEAPAAPDPRTRRGTAAHISKAAIVVSGRS